LTRRGRACCWRAGGLIDNEIGMSLKQEIFEAVVAGDASATDRLVAQALAAGFGAEELLRECLIAAMTEVGARFECGDYYVPELLVSAHAMKAGLQHLRPQLTSEAVKPIGTVVIGTVKGDLHDIGKNLVGMLLEGAGFRVIDLGVDVSTERFVQAARETGADVVALSALLTTTMPAMQGTVDALKADAAGRPVKTLIGGAPITQEFADRIGADAFAPDAAAAALRARQLVGG
jgi:5-methyltetrahydrofolate--homocysteine methyltransferase